MKTFFLALCLICMYSYSQNSGGVYGTSEPIKANIGETMNEIQRMDLRHRESKRKRNTYTTKGERILIYGGENQDVFLGCLNCDKFDKESIWDFTNEYGSSFGKYSIWNRFKGYGGAYGKYSPFNRFSDNPPILVDKKGKFYGYFTIDNTQVDKTTWNLALRILSNWESISEDTISAYSEIFE